MKQVALTRGGPLPDMEDVWPFSEASPEADLRVVSAVEMRLNNPIETQTTNSKNYIDTGTIMECPSDEARNDVSDIESMEEEEPKDSRTLRDSFNSMRPSKIAGKMNAALSRTASRCMDVFESVWDKILPDDHFLDGDATTIHDEEEYSIFTDVSHADSDTTIIDLAIKENTIKDRSTDLAIKENTIKDRSTVKLKNDSAEKIDRVTKSEIPKERSGRVTGDDISMILNDLEDQIQSQGQELQRLRDTLNTQESKNLRQKTTASMKRLFDKSGTNIDSIHSRISALTKDSLGARSTMTDMERSYVQIHINDAETREPCETTATIQRKTPWSKIAFRSHMSPPSTRPIVSVDDYSARTKLLTDYESNNEVCSDSGMKEKEKRRNRHKEMNSVSTKLLKAEQRLSKSLRRRKSRCKDDDTLRDVALVDESELDPSEEPNISAGLECIMIMNSKQKKRRILKKLKRRLARNLEKKGMKNDYCIVRMMTWGICRSPVEAPLVVFQRGRILTLSSSYYIVVPAQDVQDDASMISGSEGYSTVSDEQVESDESVSSNESVSSKERGFKFKSTFVRESTQCLSSPVRISVTTMNSM